MAKRKIVFVIVEGPSDDEALGVLLSKIYDKDSVYVHIMHGDITTQAGVNSSNIVSKVGNCVRQYAAQNHYKQADFKEIIHIVDMDGAYAPDSAVIEDAEAVKPVYSVTEIRTANPDGIISRNAKKRENIDRLKSTGQIWKLSYGIYYMSCNLDHALYQRKKKDKVRVHRLITKGAAIEAICKDTQYLMESEFYELMDEVLHIPELQFHLRVADMVQGRQEIVEEE